MQSLAPKPRKARTPRSARTPHPRYKRDTIKPRLIAREADYQRGYEHASRYLIAPQGASWPFLDGMRAYWTQVHGTSSLSPLGKL